MYVSSFTFNWTLTENMIPAFNHLHVDAEVYSASGSLCFMLAVPYKTYKNSLPLIFINSFFYC